MESIACRPETLQIVGGCLLTALYPKRPEIIITGAQIVYHLAEIYKVNKTLEATAYKDLMEEAKHIFAQMDLVEKHLEVIVDCLMDINTRCQFHQHFMSSFFIQKYFAQLFCTYSLCLQFFGKGKLGKSWL